MKFFNPKNLKNSCKIFISFQKYFIFIRVSPNWFTCSHNILQKNHKKILKICNVSTIFVKKTQKIKDWVHLLDSCLSLFAMDSFHLFKEKKTENRKQKISPYFPFVQARRLFVFLGQKLARKCKKKHLTLVLNMGAFCIYPFIEFHNPKFQGNSLHWRLSYIALTF